MRIGRALVLVLWLAAASAAHAQAAYQTPRTPDGKPDLHGNWSAAWITPLERPAEASQLVVPPSDSPKLFDVLWAQFDSDLLGPTHSLDVRSLAVVSGETRSSLIVDPADGKLPLSEAARSRRPPLPPNGFDGPEQRPQSERCLNNVNASAPLLVLPAGNIKQIVQTKDHFVILSETNSILRIVPLATHIRGAPAAGRGRWEGDVLVIETSGFTPTDRVRAARFAQFPISPKTTITERLTRTGPDEILYAFTVADTDLYTRPWTAEMPLIRTHARVYEWGCQEANYSMVNMLRGARVKEKRAAELAKK